MIPCLASALLPAVACLLIQSSAEEEKPHSLFGCSVAGLGDVDEDGTPDFLIADPEGPGPGRVLAISGRQNRVLYAREGDSPHDYFGGVLRTIGDVDGDGMADWIAGSAGPWNFDGCTMSFASVHSGRDGSRICLVRSIALDEQLGRCFAGADDVDGDGLADLVVGARRPSSSTNSGGVAYVYSGLKGRRIRTLGCGVEPGTKASDVACVGDCNGDGVPDFLIAIQAPTEETVTVCSVTLFSGASGDPLWSFGVGGQDFIQRVLPAGDVDGDGFPDAFVSCQSRILVLSGRDAAVIRTFEPEVIHYPGSYSYPPERLEDDGFGVAIALLRKKGGGKTLAVGADYTGASVGAVYALDFSSGARTYVVPTDGSWSTYHLGWRLDCAGDLDGDGWDDVICGTFSFFGKADGSALVYSGKDGHELRRFARRGNSVALVPSVESSRR